jgi:hypothetical protein
MKKFFSILFFIAAISIYFFISTAPKKVQSTKKAAPAEKRENTQKNKPAQGIENPGDFIDYATGGTAVRQYNTAKEKIDKVKQIQEKQMADF